jgi:hypothetical protein
MSPTLSRIAHFQNRRDEVPNQELAKELAAKRNKKGIREIADNLWNEDKNVQSDCIKVLYEIGYLKPELIADYVDDFIKLVQSDNNRLVWGGMSALSTVAAIKADTIFVNLSVIKKALSTGSVITRDNGIKTLAIVASAKDAYRKKIFPYLLNHLEQCRPQDVPQHSEKILVAVDRKNSDAFVKVLENRMPDLSDTRATRVKRIIKSCASL